MHGQLVYPALANGPSAAADVVHARNVSAAPNSHRERQGAWLGRNSWATFFLLFMWPEAIKLGQTAQEGFYKAHCLSRSLTRSPAPTCSFCFSFFTPPAPGEMQHGKEQEPTAMVLGAFISCPGRPAAAATAGSRGWRALPGAVMASDLSMGYGAEVVSAASPGVTQWDTSFSNKSHMY